MTFCSEVMFFGYKPQGWLVWVWGMLYYNLPAVNSLPKFLFPNQHPRCWGIISVLAAFSRVLKPYVLDSSIIDQTLGHSGEISATIRDFLSRVKGSSLPAAAHSVQRHCRTQVTELLNAVANWREQISYPSFKGGWEKLTWKSHTNFTYSDMTLVWLEKLHAWVTERQNTE